LGERGAERPGEERWGRGDSGEESAGLGVDTSSPFDRCCSGASAFLCFLSSAEACFLPACFLSFASGSFRTPSGAFVAAFVSFLSLAAMDDLVLLLWLGCVFSAALAEGSCTEGSAPGWPRGGDTRAKPNMSGWASEDPEPGEPVLEGLRRRRRFPVTLAKISFERASSALAEAVATAPRSS